MRQARAIRFPTVILAFAALLAGTPALAQASPEQVKAAFLPKFARYVEMPAAAQPGEGQPYYLCLIGRDPFGPMIERAAASETIEGHAIAVRRFASADAPAVVGCHIAYVAGGDDAQTAHMIAVMRRLPALTITDSRWGAVRGTIHFVIADGRVRFHIDNRDATARGLVISSRLLALAVGVKQ